MIKIKLGNNEKYVTKGAYNEFYEHLGYEIVNDKKPFEKEVEIKGEAKKEFKKEVETKGEKESYSRK